MRRRAGKARVANDEGRVVFFLGLQHMQQAYGMSLGGIAADNEDRLGIVDVVIAVGHGTVAPCIRNAGHGGRVTDARLMVHVVRAPISGELAEEIGLLVIVLGAAQPIDRIRTALFADLHHAVADLVDRLFPADALPLAALFLHRILEAALAMRVLAHRRALGAMRAEVERAVPAGFLTRPDAVLHLGHDRTADRAMGADGFHGLHRLDGGALGVRAGDCATHGPDGSQATNGQTAAAQERAAVDRCIGDLRQDTGPLGASRNPVGLFPKHVSLSSLGPNSGWVLRFPLTVGRHATSRQRCWTASGVQNRALSKYARVCAVSCILSDVRSGSAASALPAVTTLATATAGAPVAASLRKSRRLLPSSGFLVMKVSLLWLWRARARRLRRGISPRSSESPAPRSP